MSKKRIGMCLLLALGVTTPMRPVTAASAEPEYRTVATARSGQTFRVDVVVSASRSDGVAIDEKKMATKLIVAEDKEGSFLSGGTIPVDPSTTIDFGLSMKVKVHVTAADKLHVMCTAGQSEIDPNHKDDIVVRETSVHCVKTIAPGGTVDLDLGNDRTASFTVTPVEAK